MLKILPINSALKAVRALGPKTSDKALTEIQLFPLHVENAPLRLSSVLTWLHHFVPADLSAAHTHATDPLFLPHPTGTLLDSELATLKAYEVYAQPPLHPDMLHYHIKGPKVWWESVTAAEAAAAWTVHRQVFSPIKSDFFSLHSIPAVSLCATSAPPPTAPISRLPDSVEACLTLLYAFIILFHYL